MTWLMVTLIRQDIQCTLIPVSAHFTDMEAIILTLQFSLQLESQNVFNIDGIIGDFAVGRTTVSACIIMASERS